MASAFGTMTMTVSSLADTGVTDGDLALFQDLPLIQILDLSRTKIDGVGLAYLDAATALETLVVARIKLEAEHLAAFRRRHPKVVVVSEALPEGTINLFTGEPL